MKLFEKACPEISVGGYLSTTCHGIKCAKFASCMEKEINSLSHFNQKLGEELKKEVEEILKGEE